MIGICAANSVAFVLSLIWQCDPVAGAYKAWDGTFEAKCFNENAQIMAGGAINITLDLIVFVLPLPKLLTLEITRRKKIGVCLTVSCGRHILIDIMAHG